MTAPALTRKEAIWLACKQKSCCYTAFVVVTGRDMWRISRILEAPPWSFLVFFQSPKPRPDSFILDDSGRHFRLALAKQPSKRKKSSPPCIFLMKTRNGYHRCGLGDLRPQVCKTFPSEMVSGVVCVQNDVGCKCRMWSVADVDIAEEAALLEKRQEEYEQYCSVVASWNDYVTSAPEGVTFSFFEYCEFLLSAYDEIESGVATMSSEASHE